MTASSVVIMNNGKIIPTSEFTFRFPSMIIFRDFHPFCIVLKCFLASQRFRCVCFRLSGWAFR